MSDPREHRRWRVEAAASVMDRRPPTPELGAHLASCPECTDTWRRLGGASARLIAAARLLPLDAEPPPGLRNRVLGPRQAAHPDADTAPERGPQPALPPAHALVPEAPSPWFRRITWAGAGAVVGAAAVLALLTFGTPRPVPDRLELTGSALAPSASGSALLQPLGDGSIRVELAISGLPASGVDEFYELWLVGDSGRVSAGTFRSDGSTVNGTFMTAADRAVYPRIGITLEPDDGDPRASDQRVAGSG